MVVERVPTVLGRHERAVDRFRDVIERYDVSNVIPTEPLSDRRRVIDDLVEEIRPLLEAIAEAEDAERDAQRLRLTAREDAGSLSVVARSRLVHAEDRRRLAASRVRELVRSERTLVRFVLLRHLVRTTSRR
jgi:hypothetical protein